MLYQHLIHRHHEPPKLDYARFGEPRTRSPCLACGLGQISALALLTQFTTEIPLRYPLEKADDEKAVNVGATPCAEQTCSEDI